MITVIIEHESEANEPGNSNHHAGLAITPGLPGKHCRLAGKGAGSQRGLCEHISRADDCQITFAPRTAGPWRGHSVSI